MAAYSELALKYTTNRNSSQYEDIPPYKGNVKYKVRTTGLSEKRQHWTPMNDHYESNMYLYNDFNKSNNKS